MVLSAWQLRFSPGTGFWRSCLLSASALGAGFGRSGGAGEEGHRVDPFGCGDRQVLKECQPDEVKSKSLDMPHGCVAQIETSPPGHSVGTKGVSPFNYTPFKRVFSHGTISRVFSLVRDGPRHLRFVASVSERPPRSQLFGS